jgi:predicted enzyme related to lactoylglutathione lyase
MPRVIHFEIPAEDVDRALKFYKEVFGWEFTKWEGPMPYWLIKTGEDGKPGINGGMMKKGNVTSVTNTIDVPSVDEFLKKITEKGGQVVMPKSAIPGVGYFAYCKDTEGNLFGIMQDDKSAK